MCGTERVYRHLPERVKRQFDFIHNIPRHPSEVPEMPNEILATLLITPSPWFYTDWGQRFRRVWEQQPGCMAWYDKVSHPRIIPPDEGSPPRSANREQLIEEEHFR